VTTCEEDGPTLSPFVLTGRTREELGERARELRRLLEEETCERDRLPPWVAEPAPLPHRGVVLARSAGDLADKLDALRAGKRTEGVVEGKARTSPRVAFVFSPLRSEYPGMAHTLLGSHSSFQSHFQVLAAALSPLVDWSPEEVLHGAPGAPPLARLDVSQPLLFTLSCSLAELWASVGVHPDAVLGHSVGEIGAAVGCGALSATDGARVAVTWGRSSARLEGTGEMVSLPLPAAAVEERIARWDGRLSIAARNAPTSTAVAGEAKAVAELLDDLAEGGVQGHPMNIPAPGHSPGMAPVHDRFMAGLAGISPQPGTVPFYSAVSGGPLDSACLDAAYWSRNLRGPVHFEPAARALLRDGYDVFIEVGPRPVLASALEEIAAGADSVAVIGTLQQGDRASFLHALAEVYVRGVEVSWPEVEKGSPLLLGQLQRQQPQGLAPGRDREPLDLVLEQISVALEGVSPAAIDPDRPFKDLGLDSAAAVGVRNALNHITGLNLPSTLAYDYPTPRDVAAKLRQELQGGERPTEDPSDELDLADLVEQVLEEDGRQPERG
jgi:acyl transferase domain-containing protein